MKVKNIILNTITLVSFVHVIGCNMHENSKGIKPFQILLSSFYILSESIHVAPPPYYINIEEEDSILVKLYDLTLEDKCNEIIQLLESTNVVREFNDMVTNRKKVMTCRKKKNDWYRDCPTEKMLLNGLHLTLWEVNKKSKCLRVFFEYGLDPYGSINRPAMEGNYDFIKDLTTVGYTNLRSFFEEEKNQEENMFISWGDPLMDSMLCIYGHIYEKKFDCDQIAILLIENSEKKIHKYFYDFAKELKNTNILEAIIKKNELDIENASCKVKRNNLKFFLKKIIIFFKKLFD